MSSVIEKSLRATVLSLREELAREHKVTHELEEKLHVLEKIAREGFGECFCAWGKVHPETCPNCINLKKIDELLCSKER